jgi:hypothetical protein
LDLGKISSDESWTDLIRTVSNVGPFGIFCLSLLSDLPNKCALPTIAARWLVYFILLRNREVQDSSVGQETGYPD